MTFTRFSRLLGSVFSVVVTLLAWLVLAPTQVGGNASYIIVIGKSMEPGFHRGDLVIAHRQPSYQVGDAVVYRNLELKSFVFHRIIAEELGRYTVQGDNNSWVDTYRPSREEVIGKLWVHIPRGGVAIQTLRRPFAMALLVGVVGAVVVNGLITNKAKGRKSMKNRTFSDWFRAIQQRMQGSLTETVHPGTQTPVVLNQGELLEASFFVLGCIAFCSLVLGIVAYSRPAARAAQDDISYEHLGVFSYSASAPQGVYDADTIRSGDPIFTRLTCSADVNFQYSLVAAQAADIRGTYQLTATILEQSSGWQRIVPLQQETAFTGPAFGTVAKLDLCQMQALAQSMEAGTDFHPGTYTLLITPQVKVTGRVAEQALESSFSPPLRFRYDQLQFYLVRDELLENPLTRVETGVLRRAYTEASTLVLLGREFAIPALRRIALFGWIIALSGLVLLGWRLQALSRLDQQRFFRLKYGSIMIDVQEQEPVLAAGGVAVKSMEALAKLAEKLNAVILHREHNHLHIYEVQVGGTTYRFTPPTDSTRPIIVDAPHRRLGQEGDL